MRFVNVAFVTLDSATLLYTYISRFSVNHHYCDRVFDSKGRTCKDVGAIAKWTREKDTDDVFKAYRREYKKRFA